MLMLIKTIILLQVSHDILIKEKKKGKKQAKTTPAVPESSRHVSKLRYFEDISSYSGVSRQIK